MAFTSVKEMVSHQLDSFETERLLGQNQVQDDKRVLTFWEVTNSINEMLEDDLENCLTESFRKLDIRDESHISIEALRAAV